MHARDIRPLGAHAVQVRLGPDEVDSLYQNLAEDPLPGQTELVPGGATLTIFFATPAAAAGAPPKLQARDVSSTASRNSPLHTIEVRYDGDDLSDVAKHLATTPAGVVQWHTRQRWQVSYLGFAPGFAYLIPEDVAAKSYSASIPRRTSPRVRVPKGAVGVAGRYSAVYPRISPGGWQLIGNTTTEMWNSANTPPALLSPGSYVQFRAIRERITVGLDRHAEPTEVTNEPKHVGRLYIHNSGMQTLVQDHGRPGYAALGVTASGVADRTAFAQANNLVGNPRGAAVLENIGGLHLSSTDDELIAITGAPTTVVVVSDDAEHTIALGKPFLLQAGNVLELRSQTRGLRSVVAVRGGIVTPPILGSRSSDTLSGLGAPPVLPGTVLPVGPAPRTTVGLPETLPAMPDEELVLRVLPGPNDDWFDAHAFAHFASCTWNVSAQSNRVGIRVTGEPITRIPGEIESQALTRGAIQVPSSGMPIIFLADHPTTGGYPIIGVVAPEQLDLLAQIAPGTNIRFNRVGRTALGAK